MNISQDIVDNLPRDQALDFLKSLGSNRSPVIQTYCVFETDGVLRWQKSGRLLPEKYPYNSFYAIALRPGVMVTISLFGPNSGKQWCDIAAESNADPHGKVVAKFTGKILTALLSMGVRLPIYSKASVHSRK
jgi:hypothetical protein